MAMSECFERSRIGFRRPRKGPVPIDKSVAYLVGHSQG